MTYEDAYLDGFCKAAEAAGVNPVQLYKQAGIPGLSRVGALMSKAKDGIRFAGGVAKARGEDLVDLGRAAAGQVAGHAAGAAYNAGEAIGGAARAARGATSRAGRRFLELLRGGNAAVMESPAYQSAKTFAPRTATLRALLGLGGNAEVNSELRKVLAARLGTGVAGAGALGAGAYGTAKALQGKPDEAQA